MSHYENGWWNWQPELRPELSRDFNCHDYVIALYPRRVIRAPWLIVHSGTTNQVLRVSYMVGGTTWGFLGWGFKQGDSTGIQVPVGSLGMSWWSASACSVVVEGALTLKTREVSSGACVWTLG